MKPRADNQDLTERARPAGRGLHITRNCFACKTNKAALGGRIDKRTRMWLCATCVEVAK